MVKNIPTIERSTKIRFGKHASDDQAENTVVFNASDSVINAINEGSIYMAPLRVAELAGSNLVGYSATTKEIVDSSVPTSLLGGVTLDSATVQGNIVSNATPHFANETTAFTTGHGSNVGISNTSPTHMLSIGDKIFMSNTGAEAIKVEGNVRANRFFSGSSVLIDGNSTNKIQVSGTIKTGVLHVDNIGISNNSPTHALSLGNEGQLRLNVPTGSIYALETVGNVSAQNYIGDGGLLSNVTLQTVTDKSNVTSNTLLLTNPTTSLKAYSNVIVDGTLDVGSNLYINDTAANVLDVTGNVNVSNYLKTNKLEVTSLEVDAVTAGTVSSNIVGNNVNVITVTANVIADNVVATNISSVTLNSNVIADNVSATTITGDGSAITALNPANLSSQVLLAKGGTGLTAVAQNELLLGPASGTALSKLPPHTAASKKFLRSDAAGIAWDDVSSTLQTITEGGATTTETVAFNNTTTGLTSAGDIDIAATKRIDFATDIIIESTAGTSLNKSPLKIINAIEVDPDVVGGGTSSKNVLAINHTTGEIYDSGGQGGSTMEFIHEEGTGVQANVSIGRTAWGATTDSNLTINTYGSNVLTISGNVSADNITIGALHVSASPFNLDDVASAGAGANVTSNVLQLTATGNAFVTTNNINVSKDVHTGGNVYSQNLQLTNTQISTTWTTGSGTLEIDCKNKSYGTAPAVSIDADVAILNVTNLPSGGQIVVPLVASGADRKVLKTITTGIDFIAFTTDVSIDQNSHGLLTVSKIGASGAEKIYMNAISFTAA